MNIGLVLLAAVGIIVGFLCGYIIGRSTNTVVQKNKGNNSIQITTLENKSSNDIKVKG